MSNSFNCLSSETSPYLLQHATNPVNWFSWGDEAFAKAKQENKLMLISVGYSSCHWCHVMEKEVFSNTEVAEFMNDNYVCVKVDREERPDVDQIYMNAVQIITRAGGWPLNCFATPDGRPVFGGTYFPKERWTDVLESLQSTWVNEPQRIIEVADELTQGISQSEILCKVENQEKLTVELLKEYVQSWRKYFDLRYGAHKGAPKFPMPGSLQFLMDYSASFADSEVDEHLTLTLDKMLQGGIYDHLGGGFFRYSVDERWEVPHFEKMLYDNAQLISLYSSAFKLTKNDKYREAVYQTAAFLRREMRSAEGGFFSAIDADSEGEEGKFYTWTKRDIDAFLGSDAEIFTIAYGVSSSGNLHGKSVPRIAASPQETACVLGKDAEEVQRKIKESIPKLLNARAIRTRPITDDKIIAAWNALAVSSLSKAHLVFNDTDFLNDALTCANLVESKLTQPDGSLHRIYCKGKSSIPAFLDDYAFTIQAYVSLYRSTFNDDWLLKAKKLTEIAIEKFFNPETGMFYFSTSEHDNLISRKMELTDGVIPSSSAVMAENLMILGVYFRDETYGLMAKQMLANISNQLVHGGPYVYKWAEVFFKQIVNPAEVIAAGSNAIEKLHSVMQKSKFPFVIPFLSKGATNIPISRLKVEDGKINLCHGNVCQKPVGEVEDAIKYLDSLPIEK